jgi:hypothetical protein
VSNDSTPLNDANRMYGQDVAAKTTRRNKAPTAAGGAKSGALADNVTRSDPRLQRLIDAWPRLPEPIRRAVLAPVGAG